MVNTIDKANVQAKLRSDVGARLDRLLSGELQKHCFLAGDDAWTFKYAYASVSAFPDEVIYSGRLVAKAKKKYQRFIKSPVHHFAFCVRARTRYDMDVMLDVTDQEGDSNHGVHGRLASSPP